MSNFDAGTVALALLMAASAPALCQSTAVAMPVPDEATMPTGSVGDAI